MILYKATGMRLASRFVVFVVAMLALGLPLLVFSQDVEEYKQAYDAYQTKDYAAAEKAIEQAIKKNPESRKYFYLKALILARQKKDSEAMLALSKCKTLKPDDHQALFMLGSLYLRKKDYQKAAEALEQGLAYKPGNFMASYRLATAYVKLHKYRKAASVLATVETEGKNRFDYNYFYGIVLRSLSQHEKAIKYLEKARNIKPKDMRTQLSLANSYQREAMYDKAMAIIKPVLTKQPGNAEALHTLGESQLGAHDYKGAISTANKMTVVSANDYRGYMLRAKANQALDQVDKALPDLKKSFELDNGGACNAASLLASIYYQRKQYLEAESYYLRAYECRRNVTPLLMLAHCYYKQGRHDKALATYKKVLKMVPDNDDALQGAKSSQEHIDRKNKRKKAK